MRGTTIARMGCSLLLAALTTSMAPSATAASPSLPIDKDDPAGAQPASSSRSIEPGKPLRLDISPGESRSFHVHLEADEFAEILVRQKGLDVFVVDLEIPETAGRDIDRLNGPMGTETLWYLSRRPQTIEFGVRGASETRRPGKLEILVQRRPAVDEDEVRIQAQNAYRRGLLIQFTQPDRRESALVEYEVARDQFRSLQEPAWEAYTFLRIGESLRGLRRYREALDAFQQAAALLAPLGDAAGEGWARFYAGRLEAGLGSRREALATFEAALRATEASEDFLLQITTLNSIASCLDDLGDKNEALTVYERALNLTHLLDEAFLSAVIEGNMAVIYDDRGESERALEIYRRSLLQYRKLGKRYKEVLALHNLGSALDKLGDKQGALDHFQESLRLLSELPDQPGLGHTYLNLARLYSSLGAIEEALRYYAKSLEWALAEEDLGLEAWAHSNTGVLLKKQGALDEAEERLLRALELRRQLEERRGEAFTLNGLAELYSERGDWILAEQYFDQALEAWNDVGDLRGAGTSFLGIGRNQEGAGNLEQAEASFRLALDRSQTTKDVDGVAAARFGLARVLRQSGRLDPALTEIRAALDLIESIRFGLSRQDLRTSFGSAKHAYYALHTLVLMELHRQDPDGGWAAEALQASERSRARGFIELLAESGVEIRNEVDAELLEREDEIRQRLNSRHWQRERSARKSEQNTRLLESLDHQIASLLEDLEALRSEIRTVSPAYAEVTDPRPPSVREIQGRLEKNDLLLEYSLGEEGSFLWAVTSTELHAFELPPQKEIAPLARRWVSLISRGQEPEAQALSGRVGEELSQILLAPAENLLEKRRLFVVSEGALQYVPFAALPIPSPRRAEPATLLVEEHRIVSLPSAALLLSLDRNRPRSGPAARRLAVLADPVYDPEDLRVRPESEAPGLSAPRATPQELISPPVSPLTRAARAFGSESFPRLTHTRREAKAIEAIAGSGKVDLALDFEANRQFLNGGSLTAYGILHFATHGLVNDIHPELTGLVLSLVDVHGRQQDGFLRLTDTFALDLSADLVVLSGCKTALGEDIRGEGLVGLTRGFLYAGARSVVASLWQVDDQATATLMEHFYTALLARGLPPDAALQQAQLQLAQSPATALPYFWAGFVYQGD